MYMSNRLLLKVGQGHGTWDVMTRGRRDMGLGDAGIRDVGLGDTRTWDAGTRGRGDAGTQVLETGPVPVD